MSGRWNGAATAPGMSNAAGVYPPKMCYEKLWRLLALPASKRVKTLARFSDEIGAGSSFAPLLTFAITTK
jgi:hypothetical protein